MFGAPVSTPWFMIEDFGRATYGSGYLDRSDPNAWGVGYSGAFDMAAGVTVDGRIPLQGPVVPAGTPQGAGYDDATHELIVGPFVTPRGTTLTRRLFVPDAGGFLRYFDLYTNTTGVPVTITVQMESRPWPWFDFSQRLSGVTTASDTTGASYVLHDPGFNTVAWGEVLAGPNALWRPVLAFTGENAETEPLVAGRQTLTIPANGSVALLHYLIVRMPNDVDGVTAQAASLMNLTDPDALVSLTPEDIALVVNFRVPAPAGAPMSLTAIDALVSLTPEDIALIVNFRVR
jgi:hypothetical protein